MKYVPTGPKWYPESKIWQMANTPQNLKRLFDTFKGKAWVDASALFQDKGKVQLAVSANPGKVEIQKVILPDLASETKPKIEKFKDYLSHKLYSPRTIKVYAGSLETFLRFIQKKPEQVTNSDLIFFNNNYIIKQRFSASFQNQVVNAVKLFFRKIENRQIDIEQVERPCREHKLPNVL